MSLNLVLSYGDLSRPGGYRTRVLGELQTLDQQDGLDPFILVFDRDPGEFEKTFHSSVPHQAMHRSDVRHFYRALKRPIRLVHAHNLYSAALALSARWRHGYKVVLDYHGRIPEEYVYLGKGGPISRSILESLERWCVTQSDHVVAVSHKLANYLTGQYALPARNVSVIPCCVDVSLFTWDLARREAVRKSMSLGEKFVCVHLGSVFEWYDPEAITRVFQRIRARIDAHLLVITTECDRALTYFATRLPAGAFTVLHAAHAEVAGLLNASDLGFLLLRSCPNITTSSPAKFAEYLNSGLPVLITPDVGDFSELVVEKGIGAIAAGSSGADEVSLVDRVARNRIPMATECVTAGRELTWQAFYPSWSRIVSSI